MTRQEQEDLAWAIHDMADSTCHIEDDSSDDPTNAPERTETVCLNCCRMLPDCEPIRVDDGTLVGCVEIQSWCAACRAVLRFRRRAS